MTPPPPAPTPATKTVDEGQSALYAARTDVAARLGVDPLSVEVHDLTPAGFSSSCVGVRVAPDQPCTADLGAGFVAFFRAGSSDLRYHFLGRKFVGPVAPAQVSDVATLPPSLHVDLITVLSAYAREEFAARQKLATSAVTVVNVEPDAAGAAVVIQAGGNTVGYAVAPATGAKLLQSVPAISPDVASIELSMRQDLAARLGADAGTISILNYEMVTWPDGCLGVQRPGTVCTQALVPGFRAVLADGGGKTYEYRGTGDSFIAASFEPGAVLMEPTR